MQLLWWLFGAAYASVFSGMGSDFTSNPKSFQSYVQSYTVAHDPDNDRFLVGGEIWKFNSAFTAAGFIYFIKADSV
jgi:hypothetical protein